nr:hypothetical protein [Tanacetum cinerariifolium]GEZ71653.1 hypothetical protein [Tanacetum cinerariifolium]
MAWITACLMQNLNSGTKEKDERTIIILVEVDWIYNVNGYAFK